MPFLSWAALPSRPSFSTSSFPFYYEYGRKADGKKAVVPPSQGQKAKATGPKSRRKCSKAQPPPPSPFPFLGRRSHLSAPSHTNHTATNSISGCAEVLITDFILHRVHKCFDCVKRIKKGDEHASLSSWCFSSFPCFCKDVQSYGMEVPDMHSFSPHFLRRFTCFAPGKTVTKAIASTVWSEQKHCGLTPRMWQHPLEK